MAGRADHVAKIAEVFREQGYEGASLARIGAATGLGKGSLYHFFPGGKDEMLAAVLADIDRWFEENVFAPLRRPAPLDEALDAMFAAVQAYFRSGRRACLVGALALGDPAEPFAQGIARYFAAWVDALAEAFRRAGCPPERAGARAEAVVAGIQGAIVLVRALDRPESFARLLGGLRAAALAPG